MTSFSKLGSLIGTIPYIFNSEEEANEYEEAKASGRPTNIYPGGGLGKKQMEQRLKAAKERYK